MWKGCKMSENILVLQKKGGKFKVWFLIVFKQKGGKIAENIIGKWVLFNNQNDDGVPIFHGRAGTRKQIDSECGLYINLLGLSNDESL